MGLFGRRKQNEHESQARGLAGDAAAVRRTLSDAQAEIDRRRLQREIDLRALIRDLFEGEIPAPTADLRALIARNTDPGGFYEREIAPSWEDLNEAQRAARVEGFLDLAAMVDSADDSGLPDEIAATVRTKMLLLAWAFDETYGYLARLARGNGAIN